MSWIHRRVQGEGAVALALGSALVGATASRVVFPYSPLSALGFAVMLGVLGAAAGLRPNRFEEDAGIEWLAVLGMGVCMPACVALASPRSVCLALFLAPPAGIALAALWWSLISALRELLLPMDRAFDDPARARQLSSRWLAMIGGLCAPAAILAGDVPLAVASFAIVLFGVVRTALAARERAQRVAWLEAVRDGRVDGFGVVPAESCGAAITVPAFLRSTRLDGVLVELAHEGPYRAHPIARARVPLGTVDSEPAWSALALAVALVVPLVSAVLSATVAALLAEDRVALLFGWLLVLSGPSTGAVLLVLSSLHRARGAAWWLAIALYLLGCPFLCVLASLAVRLAR